MKGYLNQPDETRAVFWNEWYRSGDIGVMDDSSYTRPEVEECAVIGLPDKEYGERVTAFIILKEGQQLDPTQLKSYLKTKLSPFKVPKEFIPVDDLPKSSAGKILKRELKKQVLAESE
jgi:long-chain acyl-CoA synthetase